MTFRLLFWLWWLVPAWCCAGCRGGSEPEQQVDASRYPERIAFGSCSREYQDNQLWDEILANEPETWIWLGDNIYGDSEDMAVLAEKYRQQKSRPAYQKILQSMPVYGIWDDHDYGVNDGDKNYPMKRQSKELLLDFLDVPAEADVRAREGAYQYYLLGEGAGLISLILLDTRYFRDELQTDPDGNTRYLPNADGDILGEAQWRWLEGILQGNPAPVTIIGSSIQVIPEEQGFEKWGNFPAARQRLLSLIERYGKGRVLILSGDRHIAEISKLELGERRFPVYEFTSSGLTHTWGGIREEPNMHRISQLHIARNFGIIRLDWNTSPPGIQLEIRGEGNRLFESVTVPD
jgi:alkaline phosphatase D